MTRTTARKVGVGAALAVLLWLAMQGRANAHTEVLRAEPGPGTEVRATVDEVRLTFLDPVQPGVTITVTDDDGDPVPGLGEATQGEDRRTARVEFDPLVAGGGYLVEYHFTAEDGDDQTERYRFTYRPTALGGGAGDGIRTDAAGIGAASVFCATLVVGVVVALRRRSGVDPSDPA